MLLDAILYKKAFCINKAIMNPSHIPAQAIPTLGIFIAKYPKNTLMIISKANKNQINRGLELTEITNSVKNKTIIMKDTK